VLLLAKVQYSNGVLPMMGKVADWVFVICFPLALLSLFAIGMHLYRARLLTVWQLRTTMFWPQLLVRYRDHTRQTKGRTGTWYYLAIVSLILSLTAILYEFAVNVGGFFQPMR
jgi:hypothetical protein